MVTHDERLAQAADRILTIEDRYVHESDTAPPVGKNAGHDSTDL
jgi:ABC-type lipoprotein export system ATPase subunit